MLDNVVNDAESEKDEGREQAGNKEQAGDQDQNQSIS